MTEEEKELRTCYHWTEWERKAKELEQENAELREQLKEQTNFTKTYYEEIIKLHEQIESKDKFIADLEESNNAGSVYISNLENQIEKMRNCKNCKNYKVEGICGGFTQVGFCKNWEMQE